jgi:hypothetical protein
VRWSAQQRRYCSSRWRCCCRSSRAG